MGNFLWGKCVAYRKPKCQIEIRKKISPSLSIPNDTLHQICLECLDGQFRLNDEKCPICGNTTPEPDGGALIGVTKLTRQLQFFKCKGCGRSLVSSHRLIK